jgi:Flp pilus assembly protein TadG
MPHAHYRRAHVFRPFNRLRAFANDRRGTFGIIFALTLFPMVQMAGVAIDYSNATRLNARLKSAADEAALSAVKDYARTLNSAFATSKGQDIFKSQLGSTGGLQSPNITFAYGLDPSDRNKYLATATYSGSVRTYFGKFIRVDTIPLGGTAQATYRAPSYKNFFFVVDASESMGLAASKDDIIAMQGSAAQCAFVCHTSVTNMEAARALGVKTRLDVIKETIAALLDETASSSSTRYLKFSIYTMRKRLTALNTVAGLEARSTDYSALKSLANGIGLEGDDPDNWTYYSSLSDLMANIPDGGDGTTPEKAQNYVFLMTDGVTDVGGEAVRPADVVCRESNHCTGPLDPTLCAPFKESPKSATVGVLYTTYLPEVGGHYWDHVYPFASEIVPALRSCANPDYFVEGTHSEDIVSGIRFLFYQALGSVRLTQ